MDYRKQKLLKHLQEKFKITNPLVLKAIASVPRELFVAPPYRLKAYEDMALPIGFGQTISRPSTVAVMTQLLKVSGDEKILEIGTGSGYQAAVLAAMGCRVYTIERIRELFNKSDAIFHQLNLYNVINLFADGSKGWPSEAPFDRIIVTAAMKEIQDILLAQLKDGGILVAPIEKDGKQILHKFVRKGNVIEEEEIAEATFVPLLKGKQI